MFKNDKITAYKLLFYIYPDPDQIDKDSYQDPVIAHTMCP